jgi:sugar lactone lactonase YvrE
LDLSLYLDDGKPAMECKFYDAVDIDVDRHGDLYVCDSGSNRIRKIDAETGIITTVVGTGQWGFNGDGPGLEVNLTYPAAIVFDQHDRLFIADTQAHRIRQYDLETGLVTTIGGCWTGEDDERISPLTAQNLIVLSGDAIGIDFSNDEGLLRPKCSDGLDLSLYLDDGKPVLMDWT